MIEYYFIQMVPISKKWQPVNTFQSANNFTLLNMFFLLSLCMYLLTLPGSGKFCPPVDMVSAPASLFSWLAKQSLCLAELSEARGCSTNSVLLN